jgi:rSAM/selenodomain-associated transferase 1
MGRRSPFDVLLVFLKEPRPGAVKSRLAARLGPDEAAAVYRAIADEEIRRTAPRDDEYERWLLFDPDDAGPRLRDWLPGQRLQPQGDGDLGTRMERAFAEAFRGGARRAALIGTDVPMLARTDVLDALESLDVHDVAVGPAADGGYYLLALKGPAPELFRGVPWSTPHVLAATLDRAARLGQSVRVLRTLGDVDTADDLASDWDRIAPLLPADLRRRVAARLGKPEPIT